MQKNKIIRKSLVLIFMFLSFSLSAQMLGDVNTSSTIDIVDALLIAQYNVGLNPAGFNPAVADVNRDSTINIIDSLLIAQLTVGVITQFPGSTVVTLEAESAYFNNALIETDYAGYTGSGYVNTANTVGVYIEWTFDASVSGNAQLIFYYGNGGSASRPMELRNNGTTVISSLDFPTTSTWDNWSKESVQVNLSAGTNILRITALTDTGAPNLDKLEISFSGIITIPQPTFIDNNPVIKNIYTADPAVLVYNGTFYLYTGHDEEVLNGNSFKMYNWHVFSSKDLKTWTDHGAVLSLNTFSWATKDAWASQCVEKNGKFYWYVAADNKIGVAVSNNPTGPFVDAIGSPLITPTTPGGINDGNTSTIDPTVFVDSDGQAYLYYGSNHLYRAVKLNADMKSLHSDGIKSPTGLTNFFEGPYLFKRNNLYYMAYSASDWQTDGGPNNYATATNPMGPWTYKSALNDRVSGWTNHCAVAEFNSQWYFIYHNAMLSGNNARRSVCIDLLSFNTDNTINKVVMTTYGVGGTALTFNEPYYYIISKYSSKYLELANASTANGTTITQFTYSNHDCQRWIITHVANGFYKIINKNSNMVMAVTNRTNGSDIIQKTNDITNPDSQLWDIVPQGNGYYLIQSKLSAKPVSVNGPSVNNNTKMIQWEFSERDDQLFQITP